jgi:hypothetical protein
MVSGRDRGEPLGTPRKKKMNREKEKQHLPFLFREVETYIGFVLALAFLIHNKINK